MTDLVVGVVVEHRRKTDLNGFPVAGVVCACHARAAVDAETGEMVEWDDVRVRLPAGSDPLAYRIVNADDLAVTVTVPGNRSTAQAVISRLLTGLAVHSSKPLSDRRRLALADAHHLFEAIA